MPYSPTAIHRLVPDAPDAPLEVLERLVVAADGPLCCGVVVGQQRGLLLYRRLVIVVVVVDASGCRVHGGVRVRMRVWAGYGG